MPSEEHYDDAAFNYFALSVLVIILLPTTYSYLKAWKKAFSSKYTGVCGCIQCRKKAKNLQIASRVPSLWGMVKFVMWLGIWALFAYLLYNAAQQASQVESKVIFDPYEILGLEPGATEREIGKAYRRLSAMYHPDKNHEEGAQERYIQIGKAYETLTDEAVREKWEKYGNPDGPQAQTVGIALPSWLVDTKNSGLVLGVYVAFLMVIFPTIAICYWNKQRSLAPNQVNNKTMQLFASFLIPKGENMRFKKILSLISMSFEYYTKIQTRRSDEAVLQKIKPHLPIDDKERTKNRNKKVQEPPHAIKNAMLFQAHFSRLHDQLDANTAKDLHILLSHAHRLLFACIEITTQGSRYYRKRLLVPTLEAIQLAQMVTQGVWSDTARMGINTSLLQIPHLTLDIIQKKFNSKKFKITNINQFVQLDPTKRRELLEGLSETQIKDIEAVCKEFPHDITIKIRNEVDDDDESLGITAGSIVTLHAQFERPSKPATNSKEQPPVEVHCPYFPIVKNEIWWAIVADERNNGILGISRINSLRDQTEVKILFPAPEKPGSHTFTFFLLCDSYVGFDQKKPIKLQVSKAPPEPVELKKKKRHGEDSDEDEDDEDDVSSELSGDEDDDGYDSENSEDEASDKKNGNVRKRTQKKPDDFDSEDELDD